MTRKRPTTRPTRRARTPTWVIIAFLVLAATVAIGRVARIGPFGTVGTGEDRPAPTRIATAPVATAPTAIATGISTAIPIPTAVSGNGASAPVQVAPIVATIPADAELVQVVHIVDGDTIEVRLPSGQRRRVRYLGIDTPEREQPGYAAATQANRALVENRQLYLARDRSDTDAFDRLLRYLYLQDGTFVNATLIAQGWAQPVEYRPDVRHAQEFRELALAAADARAGFWSGAPHSDGPMPYGLTLQQATIRRGPGNDFDVRTTLTARTPLSIYGRTPDGAWLQVRPPSREGGWLPANQLDVRVPVDQIVEQTAIAE